jgi:hypothetical protein
MIKKLLTVASLTVTLLGTTAGVAAATPGPTPDGGLIGACNMTNANATPGMNNAIATANPNGVNGMITAIGHTDPAAAVPPYCPAPK